MLYTFDSDEAIANFAAEMGFVVKRGEYYGIGAYDFVADDLLDSSDLMSVLMARWTISNLLDMLEDMRENVDLEQMSSPRIISTAILEREWWFVIEMLADTKGE